MPKEKEARDQSFRGWVNPIFRERHWTTTIRPSDVAPACAEDGKMTGTAVPPVSSSTNLSVLCRRGSMQV